MRQICCVCKILYGLKEPLDRDEETHGFCPECYKLEMEKIKRITENEADPWKNKKYKF